MEEKKKILEMLEDGKITAEEAAKLLEALKKSFGPVHFEPFGPHRFDSRRHKLGEMRKKMKRIHRHMHGHGYGFDHRHHRPGKKVIIIKKGNDFGHDDFCYDEPEIIEFDCCD